MSADWESNKLRLLAGIKITSTDTPPTNINESASGAAIDDFWTVSTATHNSQLIDVLHRTNTKGLINMIVGMANSPQANKLVDDLVIYSGSDKQSATKEAKKRIRVAQKAKVEEEELAMSQQAEHEHIQQSEYEEATKIADEDYDGDGKIESPAEEYKGSRDKAIKQTKSNKCDCGKASCELCTGSRVSEAMHTYKTTNYDSWDEDDKKPTNVVAKSDQTTSDAPESDKNENPEQLRKLDTPSKQDQSGGGDLDHKLTVPSSIKNKLKDQAKEARDEAEKTSATNKDAAHLYKEMAQAYDDIRTHLERGTVYDLKKAQVFMSTLMGPILHSIDRDVVDYITKGGKSGSLRDYMSKLDNKYPITGPRNALES